MASRISITTSRDDQFIAASALSRALDELKDCSHAFIGGFAWAILGSDRATEDIDVLIQTKNMDLMEIRETLLELNKHFAVAGFKFYFVKEPRDDLTGDRLVFASKDNVLIETLKAGTLGLPSVAGPIYVLQHSSGVALKILHPGVLILTKMKRWVATKDSDRPKTVTKTRSDKRDLDYLVFWLVQHEMTIEFELYLGKRKEELLAYVRAYRDCIPEGSELLEALQTAVKSDDWKLL